MERSTVIDCCRRDVVLRRQGCQAELASLDEAAARETKSSAGDKYETAREMIAQSRNLVARTLAEAESALSILDRMAATPPAAETIGFGSLVETTGGWFLVGVSLGEAACGDAVVKTLTLASPLGQALKGRKAGDQISWRGSVLRILGVSG